MYVSDWVKGCVIVIQIQYLADWRIEEKQKGDKLLSAARQPFCWKSRFYVRSIVARLIYVSRNTAGDVDFDSKFEHFWIS